MSSASLQCYSNECKQKASNLPELELLWLSPVSGVGAGTRVCQCINHTLVQNGHSQVEHPHDQYQHNAYKSPQLQDCAVGPDIGHSCAQQAVPASSSLARAVHWSLWVSSGSQQAFPQNVLLLSFERPAGWKTLPCSKTHPVRGVCPVLGKACEAPQCSSWWHVNLHISANCGNKTAAQAVIVDHHVIVHSAC